MLVVKIHLVILFSTVIYYIYIYIWGAKGDWDFWISDQVKTRYLTPVVNFSEVRKAQLASPPRWCPWDLF